MSKFMLHPKLLLLVVLGGALQLLCGVHADAGPSRKGSSGPFTLLPLICGSDEDCPQPTGRAGLCEVRFCSQEAQSCLTRLLNDGEACDINCNGEPGAGSCNANAFCECVGKDSCDDVTCAPDTTCQTWTCEDDGYFDGAICRPTNAPAYTRCPIEEEAGDNCEPSFHEYAVCQSDGSCDCIT